MKTGTVAISAGPVFKVYYTDKQHWQITTGKDRTLNRITGERGGQGIAPIDIKYFCSIRTIDAIARRDNARIFQLLSRMTDRYLIRCFNSMFEQFIFLVVHTFVATITINCRSSVRNVESENVDSTWYFLCFARDQRWIWKVNIRCILLEHFERRSLILDVSNIYICNISLILDVSNIYIYNISLILYVSNIYIYNISLILDIKSFILDISNIKF